MPNNESETRMRQYQAIVSRWRNATSDKGNLGLVPSWYYAVTRVVGISPEAAGDSANALPHVFGGEPYRAIARVLSPRMRGNKQHHQSPESGIRMVLFSCPDF